MKRCVLIMNAPKTGYCFTPVHCKSIAEAERRAEEIGFPYRIFLPDGRLIKRGWKV